MDEKAALSPEILGLYEKVLSQAKEYGKAFDLLEKSRKEFDASLTILKELAKNVKQESEEAISQINTNILESLIILKNRTNDTIKLTVDLQDIQAFKQSMLTLRDELSQIQTKINRQSEEMDSTLKYFKKKSEVELESTILGIKSKIEQNLSTEGQKIELRSNLRIKQLENIMLNFDDRIKDIEDKANSAIKRISLDMDLIKHEYDPDNEYSSGTMEKIDLEVINRLTAVEIQLTEYDKKLEELNRFKISSTQNYSDKRLDEAIKKYGEVQAQLKDLQLKYSGSSSSLATGISIFAILLAVVALVLKFI